MASKIGRLIPDQNLSIRYNGASAGEKANNVVKSQKKGGLGGRKPLGDLSNSGKPAPNRPSKKANPKNFAFIEEVVTSSKATQDSSIKKNSFKAFDKVQKGSRKALSDISNSGKPNLQEESKKKQNLKLSVVEENLKLSVVEEDFVCPSGGILEEGFLHNHQECIKAQTMTMDADQFLNTLGLVSSKQFASPRAIPTVSSKMEAEKSMWHLELQDMDEDMIEDNYCGKQSSPPCKTPKSPNCSSLWNDYENINFKLMETPELRKR